MIFIPLAISTLSLYQDIPLWIFLTSIVFWLWKLIIIWFNLKNPTRFLTGFFSFVFFVLIYLQFKTFIGKEAATSFIVVLASLKILEFESSEEKDFLILLGFFMTTAKFLFSYDLFYIFISIPVYAYLTYNLLPTVWIRKYKKESMIYTLKIFTVSVPMSLLLFFLFPRVTKELNELNIRSKEGISGFSDNLTPGSISNLSLSNETILRLALIDEQKIDIKNFYLKGLVLQKHLGFLNWASEKNTTTYNFTENIEQVDYKITLEPTQQNIVFSLPNTTNLFSDNFKIFSDTDYIFKTYNLIDKRISIKGTIGKPILYKSNTAEINITINKNFISDNQTSKNLLLQLQKKLAFDHSLKPKEINAKILSFFASNNFHYSLSPGLQPHLTLDQFLFKIKKGYCEHYASAHALLLNSVGIPARVVIGYQGGEYNSMGNFWIVRQKDAHAWVEYLNENNYWVTTDPITVIQPERIELGGHLYSTVIDQMLTKEEIKSLFQKQTFITKTSMWFENLNYQWNNFLLEHDFEKQKELLQKYDLNITFALAIVALTAILSSLIMQTNVLNRKHLNKAQLIYNLLQQWAEPFNLVKKDAEGPLEWKARIINFLSDPLKKELLIEIFDLWIRLAYGNNTSTEQEKIFKTLTAKMKLLKQKK